MMQRKGKKSIIEIVEENSFNVGVIQDVKQILKEKLEFDFTLQTYVDYRLVTYNVPKENLSDLENKLDELNQYIDYEKKESNLNNGNYDISILKVDLQILKFMSRDTLSKDLESLSISSHDDDKNKTTTTRSPLPPLSNQSFNLMPPRKTIEISDDDLRSNLEKVMAIMQQSSNLEDLEINVNKSGSHKTKKFKKYIFDHFSDQQAIIEFFIFEYICRGEMVNLKNTMKIKYQSDVTKTKKVISVSDQNNEKMERQVKEKQTTEHHHYEIRANFNPKGLADYIARKKSVCKENHFLGLKDQVEGCIRYVLGEDSQLAKCFIELLEKLDAYPNLKGLFNFKMV